MSHKVSKEISMEHERNQKSDSINKLFPLETIILVTKNIIQRADKTDG